MEGSNSNFIKLEWSELTEIISDLVGHGCDVKLWEKGSAPDLCKAVNNHSEEENGISKQLIRLRNEKIDDSWISKDLYVQFSINTVEYFAKGKVKEILSDGEFWVELNPHVFKVEKRVAKRLYTYPSYQVYAYFKVSSEGSAENIVFLDRHIEKNHQAFKKFKELTEKEILDIQDSTEVDSDNEVIGFRVLDLSSTGVSFLANKKESEYFTDGQSYEVTILIDGNVYHVSNARLVYNVDFVNPRAGGVSMFKVGLTFDKSRELEIIVRDMLESEDNDTQVLKEFEDFAD